AARPSVRGRPEAAPARLAGRMPLPPGAPKRANAPSMPVVPPPCQQPHARRAADGHRKQPVLLLIAGLMGLSLDVAEAGFLPEPMDVELLTPRPRRTEPFFHGPVLTAS